MPLSMHQASVPVFVQGVTAFSALLDKAGEQLRQRKIEEAVLLNARLAPDMFTFARQVQIASDHAKGAPARLAGLEVPKFADDEASFEALKTRLARVLAFIEGIDPSLIDGSEDRDIVLAIGGRSVTFKGQPYLLHFALPNFYFHLTAAYAILRHNGVDLGKRDFIGQF